MEGRNDSVYLEAYDIAANVCLKILRDELYIGLTNSGTAFESPVALHAKLEAVVDVLGKIWKGRSAVKNEQSFDKLDAILEGLNAQIGGSGENV